MPRSFPSKFQILSSFRSGRIDGSVRKLDGQDRVLVDGGKLLTADSAQVRAVCCWKPWSYPRFAFWRTFAMLIGWPGVAYLALLGIGWSARWVWRGLVPTERKDSV